MLLDLTRYPLVVLPDECRSSVIVRTRSTRDVIGGVRMEDPEIRRAIKGPKLVEVRPTATTQQGGDTYSETKLPLHLWGDIQKFAAMFEASSASKDSLTSKIIPFRVQIGVVRKDTGLWSVAVVDEVKDVALVMIAVRGLGENGLHAEVVPLARATRSKLAAAEPTFWDRINDDD